ncbi:MAG: hypothetical protein ACI9OF_002491, partial [Saprospiraceae bacterium]
MKDLMALPFVQSLLDGLQALMDKLFSVQTVVELSLVVSLGLIAWVMARYQRPTLLHLAQVQQQNQALHRLSAVLALVLWPLHWLVLQWLCNWLYHALGYTPGLMKITASLLSAWVLIRVATTFIRSQILGKTLASISWLVAALNILGLLEQTIEMLNYVGMDFGSVRISLFTLLKAM